MGTRLWRLLLGLLLLCGFGGQAIAKPVPSTYSLSMDARMFEASASPYSVLSVQSSRLMPHLYLYGQISTDYAKGLLLARRLDTGQVVSQPLAHRLTSELAFGVGLFSWVEVALSLPVYWFQQSQRFPFALNSGGATYPEGEDSLEATGIGDLRLWAKIKILDNAQAAGFGMALLLEGSFPTGGAFLMRQAGPTFTPRLVLDYRWKGGFLVSLNAGFRIRGGAPTDGDKATSSQAVIDSLLGFRVGNELRIALGVEIPLMLQGLSLIGEAMTAVGFSDVEELGNAQRFGVELLAGLRWRHHSGVILTAGAGAGLTSGYGIPDFRFFFQVAWGHPLRPTKPWAYEPESSAPPIKPVVRVAPPPPRPTVTGPEMPKKPEVLAHRPLSSSAFDKAAKSDQDRDGDGIPNHLDKCPDEPEDFDGFKDDDGCPDPDNDGDGIPDHLDKCPNEPETVNGYKDDDGCPDTGGKQLIVSTATQIKLNERVFFRTGSDRLETRSYPILRQLASFL
ncbi:MAG: transporter [Myxococcales bacterium]|nr:transporter [Myxococcales bacterium]